MFAPLIPTTNLQYRSYVTIPVEITGKTNAAKQLFKKDGNLKSKMHSKK
jgi:hypothetical protein